MKKFSLFIASISLSFALLGQNTTPKNWFNLDLQQDGIWGLSTEKAYQSFKLDNNGKPKVVVAVIDAGTDVEHEDLKSMLWINKGEIPGNNIDDDKNGYADDVYGWSFIGGPNGNVEQDTYESTRLVVALEKNTNRTADEEAMYKNALALYEESKKENDDQLKQLQTILDAIKNFVR